MSSAINRDIPSSLSSTRATSAGLSTNGSRSGRFARTKSACASSGFSSTTPYKNRSAASA
jgi:hypothetical protein